MRVLFVGMNPGTHTATVKKGSAIWRLHLWSEALGLRYYSFVNVFSRPGAFKTSQVDKEFLSEVVSLHDGPVVALGNVASVVLKRLGVAHMTMPHPSYRNRKLNDPAVEQRCLDECRTYMDAHRGRSE